MPLGVLASYEQVGQEYYSDTHNTCRNFEDATKAYLDAHPEILIDVNTTGRLLDVGSGAGLAPKYLGEITGDLAQLDGALAMLKQAEGSRVRGNAYALPFGDSSFDTITAFLYDPFNDPSPKGAPAFEKEVARVLRAGGTFIGTLPGFEWASAFRSSYEQGFRNTEQTNDTFFTLKDGTVIREPSYVTREDDLRYRFWVAAFNEVKTYGVPASYITGEVARPIKDTAYSLDYYGLNPLKRLNIVTIVKATGLDKGRPRLGPPPSWLRQVIDF